MQECVEGNHHTCSVTVNDFTALCLSFLIFENGNNVMYLPYNDVGRVK